VAIIDTGITDQKRADGLLGDIRRTPANIDPLDTFPLPGGDGYLDLDAGHGTFIAGIVQQVAPEAEIAVYRVVDCDGIAPEPSVACAIIHAVKEGAQIINLSLGCQSHDDTPPVGLQQALEVVGELEREMGREVLIVAAAGNFGDTRPFWPAAFRGVVSVAGLAPDMTPAPWSSHGFWVTCSAIGQGICSTFVEGKLSPLESQVPIAFGPDALARWSGTSFTAPQVVGAIARLCQEEGIQPRAALRQLLAAGSPLPDFGSALRILPGL
jgi:subtilisin family serine protease